MSTSGSTIFSLSRNDIIEAALRKLGVLAKGATADSEDLLYGQQGLNTVVALLQTMGMPLWARNEYTFTLTTSPTYLIGVGQTLNTPFPLKIHSAYIENTTSNSSIDMQIEAIYDYYSMSPSSSSGTPIKLYYQPLVNYGKLTVWPTPDTSASANNRVRIIYQRPFEFFTSSAETMDFPSEYHLPLIYKLADVLAPEYSVPLNDRGMIKKEAEKYMDMAEGFSSDNSSVYFSPDLRRT